MTDPSPWVTTDVLESLPDATLVVNQRGEIVFANRQAEGLIGKSRDQLVGQPIERLVPRELRSKHLSLRKGYFENPITRPMGVGMELSAERSDGSTVPVEISLGPVETANGTFVICVMRDVTQRKLTDTQLRESEAKYRAIVKASGEGILVVNAENIITFANQRIAEILGRDIHELVGRLASEFMNYASRKAARRKHDDRKAGKRGAYNFEFIHKNGSPVWTAVSATPMQDEKGEYVSSLLMVSDMTERQNLEAQLQQALKMDAVGQLTGGVAHDFNNLLTIIIGNLQLLEEPVKDERAARARVKTALDAALRGAELTRRLLAFSRKQLLMPKVISINQLISEVEPLLKRTLGEDVTIKTKLASDLWLTEVDPSQLENALVNLAVNARDAVPEGGSLIIQTENAYLDESYADSHFEVSAGSYVLLSVTDTGSGIPRDNLTKVFEPFFTTKAAGKGTGLGLSMVYGFVKQSRGDISIYSEEGHGTSVKIYLPRARPDAESTDFTTATVKAIPSGDEAILVVEDDAVVREVAATLLTGLGYRVLEADCGANALEILENGESIDLLLTDMIMPGGMTGAALARHAIERNPELKVLYVSGYTDTTIFSAQGLRQDDDVLNKPYRKAELAQTVRELLDRD